MFKEIETELMSIMSENPIDKIAHAPSMEIAKTMDLLYNIKFEDIERVYTENMGSFIRMVVVHKSENDKTIEPDLCPINGKIYHITFFPSGLLDKSENNAITLTKAVIKYVSLRVSLLMDHYQRLTDSVRNELLSTVFFQAIPVITSSVIRQIYAGPNIPKIIYMALLELIPTYKIMYSEEGINSIFNIFDEGLGISELLDSGFICTIKAEDKNYPGIWTVTKVVKDKCNEE